MSTHYTHYQKNYIMDTGMIILTSLLIAVCIIPFVLIGNGTKKREKQLTDTLKDQVFKNRSTLTDYVIHNNYALGIDSLNHLYYYHKTNEKEQLQEVKINEIKSCEVKKDTTRVKNEKSSYELVQRVALVFTSINGSKIEPIELYNEDESTQLNGEIALANTWKQKVNEILLIANNN